MVGSSSSSSRADIGCRDAAATMPWGAINRCFIITNYDALGAPIHGAQRQLIRVGQVNRLD